MNRRHTIESMHEELERAQNEGKNREVSDLELLIRHAESPGSVPTFEVRAARNRQGARRYNRELAGKSSYLDTGRRDPRAGDMVRDPGGNEWLLESVSGKIGWGHWPPGATSTVNCPLKYLTRVTRAEPAPTRPADPFRAPAEALYAALWDVLDRPDDAGWRERVETALRAYEAALEGIT